MYQYHTHHILYTTLVKHFKNVNFHFFCLYLSYPFFLYFYLSLYTPLSLFPPLSLFSPLYTGIGDIPTVTTTILEGLSCVVNRYAEEGVDGLTTPYQVMERLSTDRGYRFLVTTGTCTCLRRQFEAFNQQARCLSDDTFFNGLGGVDGIFWELYIYVMISVATFVLAFLQISTMQLACERQIYKIRLAYYRAVLRQDIGWFDLNASGELTSRLNE